MEFKIGDRVKAKSNCSNAMRDGEGIIEVIDSYNNDMMIRITKKARGYSVGELTTSTNWGNWIELEKSNYKPKSPTHVVIWEEDRDPAKLFTSEKDAKDFIKTLSDKSGVRKDSILLLEIKSCMKVSVSKVLKYGQHKI